MADVPSFLPAMFSFFSDESLVLEEGRRNILSYLQSGCQITCPQPAAGLSLAETHRPEARLLIIPCEHE